MAQDPDLFHFPAGWRITVAGRTGSGKSWLARKLLRASSYHWLIFNPKLTHAYDPLGPEVLTKITTSRLDRSLRKYKYTSLNFGLGWDHSAQDELLCWIIEKYENIGICIDELLTLHNQGRAGPGLRGLLTRGRELQQSGLLLCQRPKWVDVYCFSEADAVIEFQLTRSEDRKAIYEGTGYAAALERERGHDFLYLPVAGDRAIRYKSA